MTQKLQIANYQDSDRRTVIAGQAMSVGDVIKIISDTSSTLVGQRKAVLVTAAADVQNAGQWGVAFKVSSDPFAVSTSTVNSALGTRITTIASGDLIVECRRGTILEYDNSLLHSSLDPDNGGTTPTVGTSLGINTSSGAKWSSAAQTSLTNVGTTIHVGRVFKVFGKKVLIELVA